MKNHIKILAAISVLAFAVASKAQVVIGNWQNNTGDGWIDNGNGLSITNVANAVKYQFVSNAVAGYAQSLEINQAGYNQNLEIDLNTLPGGKAAFLANNTLSFTVTFPSAAASGATAGYSQIYNFTVNCGGSPTGYYANIPWTNWVGNGGAMPGVGYYTGFGGQTITVSWNYSSLLTNSIIAAALTNSSTYLQLSFTSNNGGGAPTNIFMNNVALSGAITTRTYMIDDFSPAGVGPQNPANYDYYSTSNNYAAGQFTNVWRNWFGTAWISNSWDSTSDAQGNPNSGSLKITSVFGNGSNQFEVFNNYGGINPALNAQALQLTNFQCDVRFDPGSATVVSGGVTNFGTLQFGTGTSGQDYFGNASIVIAATNTGWVHVSIPINPVTDTNLIAISDILVHIYSGSLTGSVTLWVDNIQFVGPAAVATVPPPAVTISKAIPGLRIFAGSSGEYDREELATIDQNQSWIGGTYPVSYSFTLSSYPSSIGQTHIFLIPVNSTPGASPYGYNGIDYTASNGVWMVINPAGAGSVHAYVYWKTNYPANAYDSVPSAHTALAITNPTAIGKWTLAFSGPGMGTLTAPGAAPAMFNIADANVATDFANPLVAYFGLQPNATAGEGQYIDFAQMSTANVTGTPVNDVFANDTTLNTSIWQNMAAASGSLVLVSTNTPYWVTWTLPDTGYGLGVSPNLQTGPWILPEYYNNYNDGNNLPNSAQEGSLKWTLVPTDCLPTIDGNPQGGQALSPTAFFRLSNPPLAN